MFSNLFCQFPEQARSYLMIESYFSGSTAGGIILASWNLDGVVFHGQFFIISSFMEMFVLRFLQQGWNSNSVHSNTVFFIIIGSKFNYDWILNFRILNSHHQTIPGIWIHILKKAVEIGNCPVKWYLNRRDLYNQTMSCIYYYRYYNNNNSVLQSGNNLIKCEQILYYYNSYKIYCLFYLYTF